MTVAFRWLLWLSCVASTSLAFDSVDQTVTTSDGVQLVTTLYTPDDGGSSAPAKGVALFHMLGSNRAIWEDEEVAVVQNLVDGLNYTAIAMDFRGHGDSGGDRTFSLFVEDALLVYDAFMLETRVDPTMVSVIGGSIGANVALHVAVERNASACVLMSPGTVYREITTGDVIGSFDNHLLLSASSEDTFSYQSTLELSDLAVNATVKDTLLFQDSGAHGTTIFKKQAGALPSVSSFIETAMASVTTTTTTTSTTTTETTTEGDGTSTAFAEVTSATNSTAFDADTSTIYDESVSASSSSTVPTTTTSSGLTQSHPHQTIVWTIAFGWAVVMWSR